MDIEINVKMKLNLLKYGQSKSLLRQQDRQTPFILDNNRLSKILLKGACLYCWLESIKVVSLATIKKMRKEENDIVIEIMMEVI